MQNSSCDFGFAPLSDTECALCSARHLQGEVRLPDRLGERKVAVVDPLSFQYDAPASIIIPEGVRMLSSHAFINDWNITSITLPDSLEIIGANPFLNSGVQEIHMNPRHPRFALRDGCLLDRAGRSLICVLENQLGRNISLPKGLRIVGDYALEGLGDPHDVHLPDGVEEIGHRAFNDFWQLGRLRLPGTLRTIGSYAFQSCWLTQDMCLTLHEGLQSIGERAFNDCQKLHRVTVPASVSCIGEYAFSGCAEDFALRVHRGSYAERYALENDLPVLLIG